MATYQHARPKGYAEWAPRAKAKALLGQVDAVLAEYEDYLPLTIRQVFYRLVGAFGYEKTERGYARLQECLNRGRRAGLIPFEALRDDGLADKRPNRFDGKAQFWESVRWTAQGYKRDKRINQPWHVVAMVEAQGMIPQTARVAHRLDVPVMSSGGFDSLTVKHDLAALAAELAPVVFLHVGDLDPSGVCIFDSVQADVLAFLATDAPGAAGMVRFERVAVTPEQVDAYGLETAPPKETDRRGNGIAATVQAEALPPEALADIIKAAILRYTDLAQFEEDAELEADERDCILAELADFGL